MPSHREKANGDSFSGNWDESLEKYARANIYLVALLNKVLLINKGLFGAQERGYPPGISKVENQNRIKSNLTPYLCVTFNFSHVLQKRTKGLTDFVHLFH